MFNNIFLKIVPFWDNVEKFGRARQATDGDAGMRIECRITDASDTP